MTINYLPTPEMEKRMKVLFVGLGSIGRRHAKIIHEVFPDYQLFASRKVKNLPSPPYIKDMDSWSDICRENMDVAFICNPTHLHTLSANSCADRGMHLFIEKPLSSSTQYLDFLLETVNYSQVTAYVAYPFRFSSEIQYAKKWLSENPCKSVKVICTTNSNLWKKPSYSHLSETGGGAILELSHEIDICQFLFGKIAEIKRISPLPNDGTPEEKALLEAHHHDGRIESIDLQMNSPIERRVIIAEDEERTYHFPYRTTESMYYRQITYFFDNIEDRFLDNNIFDASELFKKIMEAKNAEVACEHSIS